MPSLHTMVKNVWRASLTDLCEKRCKPEYIAIVEARTADRATLEKAVNMVLKALCPFPAVKISDWLWETKAGRQVAWAQWKLYGDESLTPSQACRILWGDNRNKHLKHLQQLIEEGKLTSYFYPFKKGEKSKLTGRIPHSTYVRKSHVKAVLDAGDHNRKGKPRKKKTVEAVNGN